MFLNDIRGRIFLLRLESEYEYSNAWSYRQWAKCLADSLELLYFGVRSYEWDTYCSRCLGVAYSNQVNHPMDADTLCGGVL